MVIVNLKCGYCDNIIGMMIIGSESVYHDCDLKGLYKICHIYMSIGLDKINIGLHENVEFKNSNIDEDKILVENDNFIEV